MIQTVYLALKNSNTCCVYIILNTVTFIALLIINNIEERKGESLLLCTVMENVYRQLDFMLQKQALD